MRARGISGNAVRHLRDGRLTHGDRDSLMSKGCGRRPEKGSDGRREEASRSVETLRQMRVLGMERERSLPTRYAVESERPSNSQ